MSEPLNFLERNWWLLLVRGIAAILFGIAAFVWPGLTLAMLVLLFGAYALVDGVFGVVDGVRYRDRIANWGLWLLEGVLGIVVGALSVLFGALLVAMPAAGILSLVWLIGAWAIVFGIVLTVLAFRLRRAGKNLSALAAAR